MKALLGGVPELLHLLDTFFDLINKVTRVSLANMLSFRNLMTSILLMLKIWLKTIFKCIMRMATIPVQESCLEVQIVANVPIKATKQLV